MPHDPFQSEESLGFTEEDLGDYLLNILTSGLYDRPDLILREYIQNSHDAICAWSAQPHPARVDIQISWPNIHIFDNGPGMDRAELLQAMSSVGKSLKTISASSGFMGIGKLAGLAMASRVEIHSSKYGDPYKSWVAFNANEMLTGILERRMRGEHRPILETLNKHTRVNEPPLPEKPETHYTSVHLLDIDEQYRGKIENVNGFARSIGLIAPVIQDPRFEHAPKIEARMRQMIPAHYRPIDIYINGIPVYRPYVSGLNEPEPIEVIDDNNNLLAYGWACLNTASEPYKRQIPDEDLRGIALMQRGIIIGDRSLPEKMGVYTSIGNVIYFRWYCGELYIIDPRIIVSADRTRVRQSQHTLDFIAHASREFRRLAKRAEIWSNQNNAEVAVIDQAQTVTKIEEQIKSQGVTSDRLPRLLSELAKAQTDLGKRKKHVVKAEIREQAEDTERKVEKMLDMLIKSRPREESTEPDNTLPLSDLIEVQSVDMEDSQGEKDSEEARAGFIVNIPENLGFSEREAQIYRTIMQAIADICGGRESERFTTIALAIENALTETFGNLNTEVL